MIEQIVWLGHSSFRIDAVPRIYINPWRIADATLPADLILLGQDTYDCCSPADVAKLRTDSTRIIGCEGASREVEGCEILRPFQTISMGRVSIKAVPAYDAAIGHNGSGAHTIGFIISLNFYDIYYTGNTTFVPEMEGLRPDIVMLPVSESSRMSGTQAALALTTMKPRWAIPYSWDAANKASAIQLAQHAGDSANVLLMQPTL
jgi:L-ascorbate metabolism protein UlaG (beta-lactamase superfamily)